MPIKWIWVTKLLYLRQLILWLFKHSGVKLHSGTRTRERAQQETETHMWKEKRQTFSICVNLSAWEAMFNQSRFAAGGKWERRWPGIGIHLAYGPSPPTHKLTPAGKQRGAEWWEGRVEWTVFFECMPWQVRWNIKMLYTLIADSNNMNDLVCHALKQSNQNGTRKGRPQNCQVKKVKRKKKCITVLVKLNHLLKCVELVQRKWTLPEKLNRTHHSDTETATISFHKPH